MWCTKRYPAKDNPLAVIALVVMMLMMMMMTKMVTMVVMRVMMAMSTTVQMTAVVTMVMVVGIFLVLVVVMVGLLMIMMSMISMLRRPIVTVNMDVSFFWLYPLQIMCSDMACSKLPDQTNVSRHELVILTVFKNCVLCT